MREKRNEPCPCGSGKKYKVCCADKRTPSQWLALGSVVIFAALAVWAVSGVLRQGASAPPGKVWSEEHGHWHDTGNPDRESPVGPAPPGKEWSYEHGHWHDVAVPGLGRPPGPAPAGKVWNEDHGHWHDAGGAEPAGEFQLPVDQPEDAWSESPEEDVSYSEDRP